MTYLLVVFILGCLIAIHEAGHLVAAKLSDIPVRRFSVGLGPRVVGVRWGGTDYCLGAVPLGGYVLPP